MTFSFFDAIIPPFIQIAEASAGVLKKGRQYADENGMAVDDLSALRLTEDMFPLSFQVLMIQHQTVTAIDGVRAGTFSPPTSQPGPDYGELEAMVAATVDRLKGMSPDDINALVDKDVVFKAGPLEVPFKGAGFLTTFAMPNLQFHATTIYALLRKQGVSLGKRDYLGQMQINA